MVPGDLDEFLVVLGLGALLSIFLDEDVTSVDTLSKLTDDELKGLGIKLGARAKIRAALQVGSIESIELRIESCFTARD